VRPTYSEELMQRCLMFARDILTLIPEVESVAIVPAYAHPAENTPAGFLVGRQGAPTTPVEVLHLATQMHRTQVHLLRQEAEFLQYVDQQLAETLRQLHDAREQLANAAAMEGGSCGGPDEP
jgi:hypothetical protein